MTLSSRMRLATPRRLLARRDTRAWGAVVVPPETEALIASRNARYFERLMEEVGAWLALVGFWALSVLVLAVAIGFV